MTSALKGRTEGRHVAPAWPAVIGRWIRGRIEIWQARCRLFAADDAMLKDIGISRADIEHIIRYGRMPRPPE
jgi:uncharacterized protein YjiS (DUF1127 family)